MARSRIASGIPWHQSFGDALRALRRPERPLRVAVLGIGNELRADDAAGVLVARALAARLGRAEEWLVLDAGQAPENFFGPLRRFQPDLVLMIDAVDMARPAGTVAWLRWEQVDGLSASTHTLPLTIVADYLRGELNCQVGLIGIQVERLGLGQVPSAAVRRAVDSVVVLGTLAAGLEAERQRT